YRPRLWYGCGRKVREFSIFARARWNFRAAPLESDPRYGACLDESPVGRASTLAARGVVAASQSRRSWVILWWSVVGIIAGWMTGKIMKGSGYGVIWDLVLGVVGAVVGGWIVSLV